MDWFRSWHGAPIDPKWLSVARRAGVRPGVVSAVVWALFDYASQNADRGSVSGFDTETYSDFSGFDEDEVVAVVQALEQKGVIVDGRLVAWEKRQVQREDSTASERKRRQRERHTASQTETVTDRAVTSGPEVSRNVTQRHAPDTDTDTEDRKDANASLSEPDVPTPDVPSKKRSRVAYSAGFEEFWKGFPTDSLMSKKQAGDAWSRLSAEDRDLCVRSLPAFRAYCEQHPDYRPVHAVRYLTQRRFESFADVSAKVASRVTVPTSDPRFRALADRFERENRRRCPVVDGSWSFPVEWVREAGAPLPLLHMEAS